MDQGSGAAARLPESQRKELAIHALAGSETVTDLAAQHGVSRKFVTSRRTKLALRWMTPGLSQDWGSQQF